MKKYSNPLSPEDRSDFLQYIRMIQTSIVTLQSKLPEDESHVGSTLQQLDSKTKELLYKYAPNDS
jgi:hypothetical protein